jgi:hypothetical protein
MRATSVRRCDSSRYIIGFSAPPGRGCTVVRRLTDEEIRVQAEAARRRGALAMKLEPHATTASYDPGSRQINVGLTNGASFSFPVEWIASLRTATEEQLAEVEVGPVGVALHWESLDEDLGVMGMARMVFGPRVITRAAASLAGSVTSPAKAKAARENGKLGGRPRKSAVKSKSSARKAAAKQAGPKLRAAGRPTAKRSR